MFISLSKTVLASLKRALILKQIVSCCTYELILFFQDS